MNKVLKPQQYNNFGVGSMFMDVHEEIILQSSKRSQSQHLQADFCKEQFLQQNISELDSNCRGQKGPYLCVNGYQEAINRQLIQSPTNSQQSKPIHNSASRFTVILDLDDTLIHSSPPSQAPTLSPEIRNYIVAVGSQLNPNGIHITERPGLQEFLKQCSKIGDLILFTAAVQGYAEYVVKQGVDPQGTIFKQILYRESTISTKYFKYVKDLSRLNTDLSRTVIVDDTPQAYLRQPQNGVPVIPFRSNADDSVLLDQVLPLLRSLSKASDVRVVLNQRFRIKEYFMDLGYLNSLEKEDEQSIEGDGKNQKFKICHRTQSIQIQPKIVQQMKLHLMLQFDVNNVSLKNQISKCNGAHLQLAQQSKNTPQTQNDFSNLQELGYKFILVCDFDHTLMEQSILEQLLRVFRCQQQLADFQQQSQLVQTKKDQVELYNQYFGYLCKVMGLNRTNIDKVMLYIGQKQIPNAVKEIFVNAKQLGMLPIIITEGVGYLVEKALEGANLKPFISSVIGNQLQGNAEQLRVQGLLTNYSHECPYCPQSFCKGTVLSHIKKSYNNISTVYVCDGIDDLCPLLRLGKDDTILIRQNYSLDQLLRFKGKQTLSLLENQLCYQDRTQIQGSGPSKQCGTEIGQQNKTEQLLSIISSKLRGLHFWDSYQNLLLLTRQISGQNVSQRDNGASCDIQPKYTADTSKP